MWKKELDNLKVDVSFKVNPIRVINNSYQTEIFSVVK